MCLLRRARARPLLQELELETAPERRAQRKARELQGPPGPEEFREVELRQAARPLAAPGFPMLGVPAGARSSAPRRALFPPADPGLPHAQLFLSSLSSGPFERESFPVIISRRTMTRRTSSAIRRWPLTPLNGKFSRHSCQLASGIFPDYRGHWRPGCDEPPRTDPFLLLVGVCIAGTSVIGIFSRSARGPGAVCSFERFLGKLLDLQWLRPLIQGRCA